MYADIPDYIRAVARESAATAPPLSDAQRDAILCAFTDPQGDDVPTP